MGITTPVNSSLAWISYSSTIIPVSHLIPKEIDYFILYLIWFGILGPFLWMASGMKPA